MIVGYSGFVIVARTAGTRLDELACVDDLFVAVRDSVRADGWRIGFLGPVNDISSGELAGALALETGAPAIALSVFDSDCAWATAADPAGGAVEFYLDEETVRDLIDDDDMFEPLNDKASAGLLAWAERAGLVADPTRLVAALAKSPGPFGDGIDELTEALGISAGQAN
jgi:hypothetical protein